MALGVCPRERSMEIAAFSGGGLEARTQVSAQRDLALSKRMPCAPYPSANTHFLWTRSAFRG